MQTCIPVFLACPLIFISAPAATGELPATGEPVPVADESDTRVATLLDADTTSSMHDDTTILRNVSVLEDRTGLMFFDALRLWVGGSVQYDYFNFDGIYRNTDQGERDEGSSFRRLEGVLRAQLYEWGEFKLQYDFDAGVARGFGVARFDLERDLGRSDVEVGGPDAVVDRRCVVESRVAVGVADELGDCEPDADGVADAVADTHRPSPEYIRTAFTPSARSIAPSRSAMTCTVTLAWV